MSVQKKNGANGSAITADDVAEYLREHPDFFNDHLELLAEIDVPHETGQAVSLIERQVAVLRQDNGQLRKRIRELVDIARDNDSLISKLHQLGLEMIQADTLDMFIDVLMECLHRDFDADAVAVRLFENGTLVTARAEVVPADDVGVGYFSSILKKGKPVCGRFNNDQLYYLFGERAAQIKSVALVPLHHGGDLGFFAIASRDVKRFRAGMSTSFLAQLGDLASALLQRFHA